MKDDAADAIGGGVREMLAREQFEDQPLGGFAGEFAVSGPVEPPPPAPQPLVIEPPDWAAEHAEFEAREKAEELARARALIAREDEAEDREPAEEEDESSSEPEATEPEPAEAELPARVRIPRPPWAGDEEAEA